MHRRRLAHIRFLVQKCHSQTLFPNVFSMGQEHWSYPFRCRKSKTNKKFINFSDEINTVGLLNKNTACDIQKKLYCKENCKEIVYKSYTKQNCITKYILCENLSIFFVGRILYLISYSSNIIERNIQLSFNLFTVNKSGSIIKNSHEILIFINLLRNIVHRPKICIIP